MGKALISKHNLSTNSLRKCMPEGQSGEFAFGYWGLKGLKKKATYLAQD